MVGGLCCALERTAGGHLREACEQLPLRAGVRCPAGVLLCAACCACRVHAPSTVSTGYLVLRPQLRLLIAWWCVHAYAHMCERMCGCEDCQCWDAAAWFSRVCSGCAGQARMTPGFGLPAAHVIHAVAPQYEREATSAPVLASAYRSGPVHCMWATGAQCPNNSCSSCAAHACARPHNASQHRYCGAACGRAPPLTPA